jgi:hypothetical protein
MSSSCRSLTRVRRTRKARIDSYGFAGDRRQGRCRDEVPEAPCSQLVTTHEVLFARSELRAGRAARTTGARAAVLGAERFGTAGACAVPLPVEPEPIPANTKPNSAKRISRSATPEV